MKLVPTPTLFHSRNSLLNPLSLMNPSRLFRNFVFLFCLVGQGSFAWGDRFEVLTASNNYSDWLQIGQNEEAHILTFSTLSISYTPYLLYKDADTAEVNLTSTPFNSSDSLLIPGPCEIRVRSTNSGSTYSVTSCIKVISKSETLHIIDTKKESRPS